MKRNYRAAAYWLIASLLLGLMSTSLPSWAKTAGATSSSTSAHEGKVAQTVPTRTPKPTAGGPTAIPPTAVPPTAVPPTILPPTVPVQTTVAPAPTVPPVATPTALPSATPGVPAVPLGPGAVSLTIASDREPVWHGIIVVYSVTLINRSGTTLRDVVVADELPPGLEPGGVIAGIGAGWQGRTLRMRAAEIPAGGQLQVVFQAQVNGAVPAGTVIVNAARASATGLAEVVANSFIAMPPAELPQVGGQAALWAPH